ncbi:hypothetical protein ACN5SO_004550 [Vibrio parahaemolyticus]|nr:hypothetical protein [Vibrio parahaemolyticus]
MDSTIIGAVIGACATLVAVLISWKLQQKRVSAHDLKLFEKYKDLFVSNSVAEFYRQHDFLASFPEKYWTPLSVYVDNWHKPEFEFSDPGLNKTHKSLYKAAEQLATTIAGNTVTIAPNYSMRSVKPDNLPFGPVPEYIKAEAAEINLLVPSFISAHDAFIKLGIKRLYKNA